LVPYPKAKVHQIENAEFMELRNAAIVIKQEDLSAGYLKEVVIGLMRDRQRLKQLADNASGLSAPEAARRLAEEILRNVKKR
jgi:UDP-N-acetylglucosamine--N-acetylmuramyl-(pentapeptide) pyrophosphoryl-undecaprenol N-acetylglucosamine transferase